MTTAVAVRSTATTTGVTYGWWNIFWKLKIRKTDPHFKGGSCFRDVLLAIFLSIQNPFTEFRIDIWGNGHFEASAIQSLSYRLAMYLQTPLPGNDF